MPSSRIFLWPYWPQWVTVQARNRGCWYNSGKREFFPQVSRASVCAAPALLGPHSVRSLWENGSSICPVPPLPYGDPDVHLSWAKGARWTLLLFPACSGSRRILLYHLSTSNAWTMEECIVCQCLEKDECHPGACTPPTLVCFKHIHSEQLELEGHFFFFFNLLLNS